ncbi:MAG: CocE/NonD family hydrolase [Candidatus Sulfotelmatobacter sp.]
MSLVLVAIFVVAVVTVSVKLPGEEMTPAGIRQSTSEYVKMRDGVEIAVTINLPPDLKPGERVPVLMRTTRYWRSPQIGWALRMLVALHQANQPEELEDKQAAYFNQRHFTVLAADARGSGASGGSRATEWSPPRWPTWVRSRLGPRSSRGQTAAWEHLEFPTMATQPNLRQPRISLRSARSCRFTIILMFCGQFRLAA